GGSPELLSEFFPKFSPQVFLSAMQKEYHRLFSSLGGEKISLVESTYKPWTSEAHCALPFAREKGLLQGDSALHLSAIFRQLSLEISEEYMGRPDHLVIELEFLSSLYQVAKDEQIQGFIEDHLDWIPDLKEEFIRLHAHPFYKNAIEILALFLENERKGRKARYHGSKKIH
ncbi:MAG TPA: molecular chaperone TorD family protein, partial [Thermodesulfobacteriota bacterium]|nr:molecular chaperone TorD family protein [Thermodesulfobacteriota bacterium]